MTERRVAVDQRERRSLAHGPEDRPHVQPAGAAFAIVGGQHRDAVGVHPAQVGLHHHLGRRLRVRFRH